MKTYNMEFSFFDGCDWKDKCVSITATSKIQLMKAYINETMCFHDKHGSTAKELWNYEKQFITEEELVFPIVNIGYPSTN